MITSFRNFATHTKGLNIGRGHKVLNSLSAAVLQSEYAVRGALPIRGGEIKKELQQGIAQPGGFTEITALNIGNPQSVGQGNVTFNREVLSGMVNLSLLETDAIS